MAEAAFLTLIGSILFFLEFRTSSSSDFYFINKTETIIEVNNTKVELKCIINAKLSLMDYNNVTWMKYPRRLLTRGFFRVTPDPRFRLNFQGIFNTEKFNLLIEPVKETDTGEYRCSLLLRNEVFFKTVILIVKVPPIIYPLFKPNIYVEQNQMLQLNCNATGKPIPKVFWYALEPEYEENNKIPISNYMEHFDIENLGKIYTVGSTLHIKRVHRNMTGYYMCVANNNVEPEAQSKFMLIVKFKPDVTMTNPEIHQRLKGDTVIECLVVASPMGIVKWLHNNKIIAPLLCAPLENRSLKYCLVMNRDERHHILSPLSVKLTIFNLNTEDYGDYVCQMQTIMGIGYGLTKLKRSEPDRIFNKQIFIEDIYKPLIEENRFIISTLTPPLLQFQKFNSDASITSSKSSKTWTTVDCWLHILIFCLYFIQFQIKLRNL